MSLSPPVPCASLCVSIDFELGWGLQDRPDPSFLERVSVHERDVVGSLLELFGAHQISATWALVGGVIDEDLAHPPFGKTSAWRAPDLVERIRAAKPEQDFGSHGHSHRTFDGLDPEGAAEELRRARELHERYGLRFESFVFPRNRIAHLDQLADSGIRAFRGLDLCLSSRVRERLGRGLARPVALLEAALGTAAPPVRPRCRDGGLVEVPASTMLLGRDGLRALAHPSRVVRRGCRSLDLAVRHGGIFHLWFHPSNFYSSMTTQLKILEAVLRYASGLRDAGLITFSSMTELARMVDPHR